MSDTQITDDTLKRLGEKHKLTELFVRGTWITDEGLASLEGLVRLTSLDVSGSAQVTDKGLTHLKPLKKLKWLFLDGTAITEAGLRVLKDLPALERLSLDQSLASSGGCKELQKALPKLQLDQSPRPRSRRG